MIILVMAGGCTGKKRSPIEGAWKMVYFRSIRNDTVRMQFPGPKMEVSDIKLWSGNHVAFVGRFHRDSTFSDNYGGGTYKLEGNRYEESLDYHSNKSLVGKKLKMTIEIRNDTLFQIFPVNEDGEIADRSSYIVEKFVRLE